LDEWANAPLHSQEAIIPQNFLRHIEIVHFDEIIGPDLAKRCRLLSNQILIHA
jgi:hypothetical protein